MKTFVQKCIDNEIQLSEIDDFIGVWHENKFSISLFEFLGMDENEYKKWVLDDSILPDIIKAHKRKK